MSTFFMALPKIFGPRHVKMTFRLQSIHISSPPRVAAGGDPNETAAGIGTPAAFPEKREPFRLSQLSPGRRFFSA
jgi:hypothetical protein